MNSPAGEVSATLLCGMPVLTQCRQIKRPQRATSFFSPSPLFWDSPSVPPRPAPNSPGRRDIESPSTTPTKPPSVFRSIPKHPVHCRPRQVSVPTLQKKNSLTWNCPPSLSELGAASPDTDAPDPADTLFVACWPLLVGRCLLFRISLDLDVGYLNYPFSPSSLAP